MTLFQAYARRGRPLFTAAAAAMLLSGCGNLTGLIDAQDQFGCPMTGGVTCQTVSQTYEAEHAKETEAQKPAGVHRTNLAGSGLSAGAPMPAAAATPAVVEGMTVRTQTDAADAVARAGRQQQAAKIDGRMAALRTRPARISARAPERVLMLWILPWVDDDGDLHDASRVWMRVQDASWRIERVRNRTINGTAPGVEP